MVKRGFWLSVMLAVGTVLPALASDQFEHEALLFLDAQGANKLLGFNDHIRSPDGILEADVVYSASWNRLHFLTEYLLSTKETELERMQIGWQIQDDSRIWLGRFHVPSNYWTTAFHHGKYLQISISNPGISEFEDAGGAIPIHSTGLLLDTAHIFEGGAGIKTAFSVGTASVLEPNFLESFDIFDPSPDHKLAFHFRFSYLPDYFADSQFGIHALYADINAEDVFFQNIPVSGVELINVGAFFDWRFENWHVFSVVSHLIPRLKTSQFVDDHQFTSGYVQTEFEFNDAWTVYGRLEASRSAGDSKYLSLIPGFVKSRELIGTRFDFWEHQALTLELANVNAVQAKFGQILLQWSAVFP